MEQMSERDIRALKRHQASLELERKELLEKLERQKARIRSLENKGEDAKQKEATANISHGPLQAVQGATSKPVISREEEVRQAIEPRSLESWREDLDRWLKDSKSSVKDGATVESPILLRSPGSVKSLPVFSDDEDMVRKEPIEKGWTLQKGDLSSRIDVLRKTITSSVKMDPESTTQEVIEKMESVFGNVASGESVLQEFYTASQRKDESVAEWGIRLEDIFQKAVAKGYATAIQKNKMLRERFWRSLYSSELKNATRLHFLSEDSFETLRRKVRAEETEMSTDKTATGKQIGKDIEFKISPTVIEKTIKDFAPKPQHQPVTQDPNKKAIDDLAKRLQSLEKTIQTLVNVMPQSQGKDQQGNVPPKAGKQDRNAPKQPSLNH